MSTPKNYYNQDGGLNFGQKRGPCEGGGTRGLTGAVSDNIKINIFVEFQ